MRELRHPWPPVHGQDRESRQRSSKPRRQYELSGATTLLSLGYLFCYGRLPLKKLVRSLSPSFESASLSVRDTVRQAFTFTFFTTFPTWLSLPLGPADIFSAGRRPSQTARLSLFPCSGLVSSQSLSSVTLLLRPSQNSGIDAPTYAG